MTVEANTPFGTLAPILKTLAIFFLAIDPIASARSVLDGFLNGGSHCSLLRHTRVFCMEEDVLLRGLLG